MEKHNIQRLFKEFNKQIIEYSIPPSEFFAHINLNCSSYNPTTPNLKRESE